MDRRIPKSLVKVLEGLNQADRQAKVASGDSGMFAVKAHVINGVPIFQAENGEDLDRIFGEGATAKLQSIFDRKIADGEWDGGDPAPLVAEALTEVVGELAPDARVGAVIASRRKDTVRKRREGPVLMAMLHAFQEMLASDPDREFAVTFHQDDDTYRVEIEGPHIFDAHFGEGAADRLTELINARLDDGQPPIVDTGGEAILDLIEERGLADDSC